MRNAFLSVLVMLAAWGSSFGVLAAKETAADGLAAQVNENYITIGDVMKIVLPMRRQLEDKYSGAELKAQMGAMFTNGLNSLIERRLILDSYQKQENKFPDSYIEGRVDEIVQDMFSGNKADFMAALAKEKINYDEWRNEMKEHVIASTMRKMNVEQNVNVSARAVRKVYDDNLEKYRAEAGARLRMIVVNGGSTEEEKSKGAQKAAMLWKKLAAGADFAATATEFSEGSNAAEGGDRGVMQLSNLRPELAKAAARTKVGEFSGIISTADQFYIIKVEERKDSFADLQTQIEKELRKAESEKLYSAWIVRLRKDAYVKVFDADLF